MFRKISAAYTAGVFAAFLCCCIIWLLGHTGLTSMMDINIKPKFSLGWLYPRLFWGGIASIVLLIPFLKTRPLIRGIVFSLIPSTVLLLKVFPETGGGFMGMRLGSLTPLFIILLGFLYGITASSWHKACEG